MSRLLKIPVQERPRERLARYGSDALSIVELLAIVLSSGTKERSVLELATDLISHFGSLKNIADATIAELKQVKGIKAAKALQLQAAFALLRHLKEDPERIVLKSPESIYDLIRLDLEKEKTEVLILILRDVKKQLIHREILGRGTLTELLVHPREVFHVAIRHRAHSVIIAHNHPSGDPTPSRRDVEMTEWLLAAGRVVGIDLVDHLIIGKKSFVSLYQKGIFQRQTY